MFIDLRDRSGIVQVVFNPETSEEAIKIADTVRNEYVIQVHGQVVKREESTVNHDMKTGTIEIIADQIDVLNKSKNPPFLIENETDVSEDLRLKYRYLDLRRQALQQTFKMRHQITQEIRHFLNNF